MSYNYQYENNRHSLIVTLWGNEDAVFMNEEVLYESEQVMIVRFKMLCNDTYYNTLVWNTNSHIEYIHKSKGIYKYIGQVNKLHIIQINRGIAEIELIIIKNNSEAIYKHMHCPCSTKYDVCEMRRWTKMKYEDLIKKVTILFDNNQT